MSAVAAWAAPLAPPRSEFIGGAPRSRLRSVPAQAGPVVPLELGNPLQLTETMRTRLLAAVRALVSAPTLDGACDATRLASVVLLAKARVAADYSTEITTAELGRWLGLGKSRVAHTVLPELRERGVVGSNETNSAAGRATGLECWVIPMYRAQQAGDRRHVLALSRVELAVLLKLIEVLFAPGWTHKDGRVTPAGMLADRTGRGAATDRLGLLLMVLSTNSKGWLKLCPGSVDTERGRPAATVGRLLGCSPSGGAKVLARLEARGTVTVDRRETASQMNARSRVRLLPVAQAHGLLVREARESADAVFSDLAVTASGDLETGEDAGTLAVTGVSGAGQGQEADTADLAVAAHLHASHASGVTPGGSLELSCGFSGEGRGGTGSRPERAGTCEDQAPDADAAAKLRLVDREGGPLRGEQREKSPSMSSENSGRGPVVGASVRAVEGAGQGRQQRGRVPLPPEDLRVILEPVRLVWERLERRGARKLVESATRTELLLVEGFAGRVDAPQILADRLTRRLEEQMRLGAPITNPVGWLVSRALPQRQECGEKLCDEGVLLDSGRECPRCEDRRLDSRDRRRAVAAAVDAAMPYASPEERRTATERQLHETVTAQAWAREHRWEQARARKAAAAKDRAEAAVRPAIDDRAAPSAPVVLPAPRPAPAVALEPQDDVVDQAPLVLEELTREQVLDWRNRAAKDHQLVFDHIDRYGEVSAQRLFTRAFVSQVTRMSRLGHLNLGYTTWERS
ncbi:hypothetical protein [Streptomyces scabiei]|uniref:hypothetical protein n=1 Tax=Streptomyces scabiei TaxID=1930 RepID=UPI0027DF4DCD|nr:hypothetical protein [Streptomyces sp. LBUM 1488]